MRSIAVIAGLAAVAVALAPAPTAAPAAAAAPADELAFVRGRAGATEIYTVKTDGRGLRRLTNNRFSDFSPVWSPDGERLLFVSNRDGDDELYVMDARGRNVRQLTRNRRQDVTPRWSPDGRHIAFASDRGRAGEPEIWLMRANGTGARRLVRTRNHPTWQDMQYSPVWSPDGKRVLFSMAAADSNPELYVVGSDGRGLKRLTRTRGSAEVFGDDTMPDWAADGSVVLFVSNREQTSSDVWGMAPDGTRQRPLVRRPGTDDWNPRPSPDGRTIAFTEHVLGAGRASIVLMNRDGSRLHRLGAGAEPDWRPRQR